ncbi:MAG: HEPN domain-containing protein [Bacteroidota bacterium]
MMDLFATKNYHWALFIGHLIIEKLLKALFIKQMKEMPPLIHDLRRIAEKAGIAVDEEHKIILDTITRFNINQDMMITSRLFMPYAVRNLPRNGLEKLKKSDNG